MDCSIYVHIPFCESKCFYCAFASFSNIENEQKKYFEYLEKEIKRDKHTANIKSIYIGGGTPTSLDEKNFKRVVECAATDCREYTVEAGRPDTINSQ